MGRGDWALPGPFLAPDFYHKSIMPIAVDFETYYSKEYSVRELGAWAYANHPEFDPYMISVSDGSETWAGHPSNFCWSALEGEELISHNAAFDRTVYQAMVKRGLAPVVNYKSWECSANLAAFLAGAEARDLKSACEILLGVAVEKDMRNWMKGRTWASVLSSDPDRARRMLEYAKQDAVRCHQIWVSQLQYWPALERQIAKLTMDCTSYGVAVDVDRLNRYLTVVEERKWDLEKLLPWVADGEKAGSATALCELCRKEKIPAPPLKKDDAEAFEVWQATYRDQFDWVAAASDWRKVGKMLSFLKTVQSRLRDEGDCFSVETPLKYFGAHTGRWSGDSLNFQNMRRAPLMIGDIPIDVRGLFIPRPGHRLLVADYSQIEPRVLAWLTGDTAMLDLVRSGFAVYEAHARATMGWAGGVLKEENPALYSLAKARVLGLGYGCGWEKFITLAYVMAGLRLDKDTSQKTVTAFRESNPKITKLWRKLDDLIEESLKNKEHLELELPSGRSMHYLNVHKAKVVRNKLVENEAVGTAEGIPTHDRRQKWSHFATYGGRRRTIYGALLAENITQATARDVFAETLIALNGAGLPTPFHTHDEFVIDMPEGADEHDAMNILKKCPDWLTGCPIAVDAKFLERYTK